MRRDKSLLYLRGLCPEVKKKFKAACVRKDVPMQNVAEALMVLFTRNPGAVAGILETVNKRREAP